MVGIATSCISSVLLGTFANALAYAQPTKLLEAAAAPVVAVVVSEAVSSLARALYL